MKVLHFTTEPPFENYLLGGRGRFIQNSILELSKLGVEQSIITDFSPDHEQLPCKVHHVNPLKSCTLTGNNLVTALYNTIRYTGSLASLLASERFDWIIIHDTPASDRVFEIAHAYGMKTLLIIHLSQQECLISQYHKGEVASYHAQQEWHSMEQADVIATTSQSTVDKLLSTVPKQFVEEYRNRKVFKVFYGGVDRSKFKRVESEYPETDVLWAHRICHQKGAVIMFDLIQNRPDLTYSVCGEISGIVNSELKSHPYYIRMHYLREHDKRKLDYVGQVNFERLCGIASKCFCFIMPTMYEPFGLVALEMMAIGIPVICSGKDGLSEFCVHGENSIIVKENKWNDYSDAIDLLKKDNSLREKIISGGFETVSKWSWDNTAKEMLGVLNK